MNDEFFPEMTQHFEAEKKREEDAARIKAVADHRHSLRTCWPEWSAHDTGIVVGTRIEVANCMATLADNPPQVFEKLGESAVVTFKEGSTLYAYMAPCRIVEVIDEETWIGVIDYEAGTDSAENRVCVERYNGIRLKLDILDIWAPVKLLTEARRTTERVRCPDHKNGGATTCPRGGAELQLWQKRQWEGDRAE